MKTENDIETIEYKGYTIHIQADDNPYSPREWDNLGTMVCWHRNYILGDVQPRQEPIDYVIEQINQQQQRDNLYENIPAAKIMAMFEKHNLVIPIMAYEHGGITIRAYDYGNFPDQQWDCGQLGFIFVSKDKIKEEYGNSGKRNMEKARQLLLSEIKTYDDYLTGQVYGYIIEDEEGEHIDSCWGYYGEIDDIVKEAKSIIDYEIDEAKKKAWEKYIEKQPYLTGMEA